MHTTDSKHSYQIYPNLEKGLQIEAPNRCRVADLTYVRLPEGFVYVACILDICSRKCIGWSLSRRIDVQLPLQALEMTWAQRQYVDPRTAYRARVRGKLFQVAEV